MSALRRTLRKYREMAADDQAAAKKLIDKQQVPEDVNPEQLAAWFYVATILLNLDETITKG